MNDRAYELARRLIKSNREYLDDCPQGVPLQDLDLDDDAHFHDM